MKNKNLELLDHEVHTWIIDLVHYPVSIDTKKLSKDELRRAESYKRRSPKETYLKCRYALRYILGFYLDEELNQIEFEYNPFGKPFLKLNTSKEYMYFNLSHCQNVGCISITKGGPVGVDVEKFDASLLNMCSTFMSKQEINLFNLSKNNKNSILYHLWVQKEAVLKAKGTGMQTLPTKVQGIVTSKANLRNEVIDDFYVNTFQSNSNILAVSTSFKANIKFINFKDLVKKTSNI